jgi:hypothetical protein
VSLQTGSFAVFVIVHLSLQAQVSVLCEEVSLEELEEQDIKSPVKSKRRCFIECFLNKIKGSPEEALFDDLFFAAIFCVRTLFFTVIAWLADSHRAVLAVRHVCSCIRNNDRAGCNQ